MEYQKVSEPYAANNDKVDLEMGTGVDYVTEKELRNGFIRKVYGILSFQLLITTLLSCAMTLIPSITEFVLTHTWPMYTAFALSFVLLIALMCFKDKHPTNMILLAIWTLSIAYTVGVVCAAYNAMGLGGIVIEALVLTMSVFVGLTIFTFQSKFDFSFLGAGLSSALWILIFWGLINMLFGFSGGMSGMLYSLAGAIIFSLYIIFDTWMIMKKYGYDDYILGAISLYLDIINLFLFILDLLSRNSRN